MSVAVGIDLGAANTVVAYAVLEPRVLQNRENDDHTPSAVCSYRNEIVVGKKALDRMGVAPQDTILRVRDLMGRAYSDEHVQRSKANCQYQVVPPTGGSEDDVRVVMGGKEYSPIEISAFILKKVKADAELRLNERVERAVITVPAWFTEKQKLATRQAAQLAELNVQILLEEPTAAAVAFGMDNVGPEDVRTVLVYDLGASTFDVSLLAVGGGVIALAAVKGDMWLGGDDFDRKIIDHVLEHIRNTHSIDPSGDPRFWAELRKKCEWAKKELSSVTRTDITLEGLLKDRQGDIFDVELELTRGQFERMIHEDVQRTFRLVDAVLEEVRYRPEDVDYVILVGGSSTITMIRRGLADKFGEAKIIMNVDPMKCVAYGAAIMAHRLGLQWQCSLGHANVENAAVCVQCGEPTVSGGDVLSAADLHRVTPTALGIQGRDDKYEVIIPKGSYFPTPEPARVEFLTPQAGLRRIRVPVYQGENPVASKNELQITVWLELPPNLPEKTPVEVGFRLDRDGILDQVTVALKDGSGRQVVVYPDRGGERRSRLEKKMDQLHQEWVRKRLLLGDAVDRGIENLYGQAAEAANRQELDTFEQILQEMETALRSRDDYWKSWDVDMFAYPLAAPEQSGLLVRLERVTSYLPSVTSTGIGIQGQDDRFEIIIPKGSSYPTAELVRREFLTPQAARRRIRFRIYQGEHPVASRNELQLTVWLCLRYGVPKGALVEVGLSLASDGLLDRIEASLKGGSGPVTVYRDYGVERRGGLEERMEQLYQEWVEKRPLLSDDTHWKIDDLYNDAADAATGEDLDTCERILNEMEAELHTANDGTHAAAVSQGPRHE
ncbi:MAG: Hsp70 family protein [Bryobacteraceae bacterium]|jgi:molecular chaperone DnaK (HSP70)